MDQERRAYERDHSIQFQWVVFARPDVTYVDPLPPLRRLSPGQAVLSSAGMPVDGSLESLKPGGEGVGRAGLCPKNSRQFLVK